jgi:hypothetical protein
MKSRDPRDHKPNRSTLELHPDFVAQLNEFALTNRMVSRVDAIRFLLRYALEQIPPLPAPPFIGGRAMVDPLGNFGGWTTDL